MPTYDFRCPQGHDFEKFYRKISDGESQTPCPTCGQMAERRVSGGAGLLFKGSGFYLTDYGKNAHRSPASAGANGAKSDDGAAPGDPKPDAKPDAKPDVKVEAKPEGKSAGAKPAEAKAEAKPAPKGGGSSE
jgi:putative FmdB family regulatory protein